MTALSNAHYTGVVDTYDFRSIRKLVDVGGGHGRLISMILTAYPRMRGVLFDLPHAFEGGQKTIAEAGLSDRCEVVSGDFFRSVPAGGDAYILSRVIHDWTDEKAVAILKVVRGVLPAKGRLLLFETMIRAGNRLSYPLLSDLNMVIRTGGCERTEAEYRTLYKAAGFRLTRAIETPVSDGDDDHRRQTGVRSCIVLGARAVGCFEFSVIRNDKQPNPSLQPTRCPITSSQPVYEIRPRKDHRGVDLISDVISLIPSAVMRRAQTTQFTTRSFARSHRAVIRVYDEAGNVIETHEGKRAAAGEARLWAVTDAQQSCITRCAFSPMRKQMRLATGWSRPSDAALGAMS